METTDMGLDILTPNGQKTVAEEQEAIAIWNTLFPKFTFVETNKKLPADIDGFVLRDNVVAQVIECKCRQMTLLDLERFDYEWLITNDKLIRAAAVSKAICAPLFGWLYLVPEKLLLAKQLTDNSGEFLFEYKVKRTTTQATCNGGSIVRENDFIDMSDSIRLRTPT